MAGLDSYILDEYLKGHINVRSLSLQDIKKYQDLDPKKLEDLGINFDTLLDKLIDIQERLADAST